MLLPAVVGVFLLFAGCDDFFQYGTCPAPGTLTGPCLDNNTCDDGLYCNECTICVEDDDGTMPPANSPDIELRLINNSIDVNTPTVVIFQKNIADPTGDTIVAWKVIENCATGWSHPFKFSLDLEVGAGDSWGNYTQAIPAYDGQAFEMVDTDAGHELVLSNNTAVNATEIEIWNKLEQGSLDAVVFRNSRVLARKAGISPGEKAVFEFYPKIWIGIVSQIEEGEVMNSTIVSSITTELSLLGVQSADIVMNGGGYGPEAAPITFHLENVQ